mgnify:CR=1 FL=1
MPGWPARCDTAMRHLALIVLATAALCAADAPLAVEALYGTWAPDAAAATPAQRPAVADAAKVEGYGITFTARICRVVLADDDQYAGPWRLDQAAPGSAVLVVQPKGGEERRLKLALAGKHLSVDGGLPLAKAAR